MPRRALAELRPVGPGDQRRGEARARRRTPRRRQKSTPAGMLPHWSRAAVLQRAAVPLVQLEEVVRLQDLVAELGEADARLQPGPDDLPGEHLVDREVLADVAQELDRRQRRGPVQVVDHPGGVSGRRSRRTARPAAGSCSTQPATTRGVVERALALVLGVADQAGRAADQQQRPVAGQLQPPRGEDLHQVADLQARARSGRSRHRTSPARRPDARAVRPGRWSPASRPRHCRSSITSVTRRLSRMPPARRTRFPSIAVPSGRRVIRMICTGPVDPCDLGLCNSGKRNPCPTPFSCPGRPLSPARGRPATRWRRSPRVATASPWRHSSSVSSAAPCSA